MMLRAVARVLTVAILPTLLPLAAWAQTPTDRIPESAAPPEVNEALRARAKQFFDYHIGTVNRRAIDMVAEESKDAYFSSSKASMKAFAINNIEYFSKDFDRAAVTIDATRMMQLEGQQFEGTSALVTNWKLEDGQWVWFLGRQTMITPMGESDLNPIQALQTLATQGTLPEGFNTPEAMAQSLSGILGQTKTDKKAISFKPGQAGKDQVVLTNGFSGQVSLDLFDVPTVPGLTISLDKKAINPGDKATVSVEYAPQKDGPALGAKYGVRLVLSPFQQTFPISISFDAAQ